MRQTVVRISLIAATVSLTTPVVNAGAQENKQLRPTAAVQVTGNPSPVRNYSSPLIARNPKNGQLAIASVEHAAPASASSTSPMTTDAVGVPGAA